MTAVEDAFRWARIHAVRHMAACDTAGLRWGETAITEIVTSRAAKAVTIVPFTQRAEALSGADWIWWWVDGHGAYGMLVQAKRVTVSWSKWKFDFSYPKGTGRQRSNLMAAAAHLGILPVYALYLGTGDYRGWDRCPDGHRSGRCLQCVKRSISLMPALLANELLVDDSSTTYEQSVALEDLWLPSTSGALIIPAIRDAMAPELAEFLTAPQDGTWAVTRAMADRVLRARYGAFGAPTAGDVSIRHDGSHDQLGPIFDRVPDDTGRWNTRYFEHTLSPLLHAPPSYVLEIMSGDFVEDRLAADLPDNVAGVVVVDLSGRG